MKPIVWLIGASLLAACAHAPARGPRLTSAMGEGWAPIVRSDPAGTRRRALAVALREALEKATALAERKLKNILATSAQVCITGNAGCSMQIQSQARARAREWLARVRLDGADDKYVHELSGGMRQRVSLARALAIDPEIVFLDESFSQLDHVTSKTLRRDFLQIAREFQKTCLLITHRIDDALEMADRALVLSPPAKIALEVRISDEARSNPREIADLHAQIASAMGAEPQTEH